AGRSTTVKVATLLVTAPAALVTMQRYPATSAGETLETKRLEVVAPATLPPSDRLMPSFCHWNTGEEPVTVNVKLAVVPAAFVEFAGCTVITSESITVRLATELVIAPAVLVITQR